MRQEFFRYYFSPVQAALLVCVGIDAVYGGWGQLPLAQTWPFLQFDNLCGSQPVAAEKEHDATAHNH